MYIALNIILIVGLPIWYMVATLSSMAYDSGPSIEANIFVGVTAAIGPLTILCLILAYRRRTTKPRQSISILTIPFLYGGIWMLCLLGMAGLEFYHEARRELARPPEETVSSTTQQLSPTNSPEASINASSLQTESFETTPEITGTAIGFENLLLAVEREATTVHIAEVLVINGKWSYKIPDESSLAPGLYTVLIKDFAGTTLDEGILNIHAYGD